jgi:hypothetical protein
MTSPLLISFAKDIYLEPASFSAKAENGALMLPFALKDILDSHSVTTGQGFLAYVRAEPRDIRAFTGWSAGQLETATEELDRTVRGAAPPPRKRLFGAPKPS